MGYHRAGFDVVGVDIEPQPRYPFEFIQADALKADLNGFDAVHASPPCQRFTALRTANPREYPDLISGTRTLLAGWGGTWVIENVPGAPLVDPIQFCGSSLGLGARCADGVWRQLRRHRLFESNTALSGTACAHVGYSLGVYGHGRWAPSATRRGAYQGSADEKRAAMDIDWMTRDEVAQAIPPAYTEHIGRQLLALLRAASTPNRPLRFSL
jgi:DNA (cytosine-5)-methyltransferase 1